MLMDVPLTISEGAERRTEWPQTKAFWNCLRNGPFSEAFKATLSQSLAGIQYRAWVTAKHGLNLLLPHCLLSLFAKTY